MENCREITQCLCCDGESLRMILDLGSQPPANNYNVNQRFPLQLKICLDCSHAQLSHEVNPSILFEDYPYLSGASETMKRYYKSFAEKVVKDYNPKTVFEVACNDGSQLDAFRDLGVATSGIDPAKNLHAQTVEKGHNVTCGYFPEDITQRDGYDVIIAQNVLAHNADPYTFLSGCKEIMRDDSALIIQTSQANMIKNHQFDTIYHEHISFFNRRSISKLFNRCDLEVVGYEFLPDIHGGSDLFIVKKLPKISVLDYSDFSNRSYRFAQEFKDLVKGFQKTDDIICYGAAAKMINLIRFTGIEPDKIIDDTPTKDGKVICGHVIEGIKGLKGMSGYIIPVWNFYDEIKEKINRTYPGQFKFIKYVPSIEIE